MPRSTLALGWLIASLWSAARAEAQGLSLDTARALDRAGQALRDSGRTWGEAIWPGFRPDTIPLLFVVPGRGSLLLGWREGPPEGFAPLSGGPGLFRPEAERRAASTSSSLAGHPVAQMVVGSLAPADLVGLALHESFHVFERSVARDDRKFGGSEQSWLVSRYPVFDVANEAGMALEGRILHAALAARSTADARRLALQYAAARERRTRSLDPDFAAFELMAEENEGLAEYALERGHAFSGEELLGQESLARLDRLTSTPGLSVRLRFYSTGSALALLLDHLAGAGWKQRLMDEDLSLFELLARVAGFRDVEERAMRQAATTFDFARLQAEAGASVAALRTRRARQVDSVLARPGLLVEVDGSRLPGRFIGLCGFDPQNMLQAGDGVILHTRWLRICSGSAYDGEFNTPVVQGNGNTVLRAVIGAEDSVRITVRGAAVAPATLTSLTAAEEVRIEGPGLTLRMARADLERDGRTLRIKLYRQ